MIKDPAVDPGQADEAQAYMDDLNYTLCAFCRQPIAHDGDGWLEKVADHPVYKLGELAYIEIAHTLCAPWDPESGWRV